MCGFGRGPAAGGNVPPTPNPMGPGGMAPKRFPPEGLLSAFSPAPRCSGSGCHSAPAPPGATRGSARPARCAEIAEVLEAFDAGRDDDEQIGVAAGGGGDACGMRGGTTTRSPCPAVTASSPRQELGGAVERVEHLGAALVVVRGGAAGAAGERDALCGQGAAGRAAVGEQPHGGGPRGRSLRRRRNGRRRPRRTRERSATPRLLGSQTANSRPALTSTATAVAKWMPYATAFVPP